MTKVLVKSVQITGVHIAKHGTVAEEWNKVNELCFDNPVFTAAKEKHYMKGDHGKVKAKYTALSRSICETLGWGDFCGGKTANLSGYSGDLAEVATILSNIHKEVEADNLFLWILLELSGYSFFVRS